MLKNKIILLVDDDSDFSFVLSLILKTKDFECVLADTAVSGLKKLDEFEPYAAIIDLKLPDMDGVELSGKIKNKYPDLPVIILSAMSLDTDELLKKSSADHFIMKPLDKEKLFSILG